MFRMSYRPNPIIPRAGSLGAVALWSLLPAVDRMQRSARPISPGRSRVVTHQAASNTDVASGLSTRRKA